MNILFITYFFPPRKAIASIRTYELCKGLLAAGHDVHVATSCFDSAAKDQIETPIDWDLVEANPRLTVSRIPSPWRSLHEGVSIRSVRGVWNFSRALFNRICAKLVILCGFDPMLPWAWAVERALAASRGFDCVLVSAGPFSTLLPARALAKRYGVPLILDYRDVWNDTPHTRFRFSTRCLERSILRQASLLVSISPSCLASIRGKVDVPGLVITNGIGADVDAFASRTEEEASRNVVYAGAFYPPKRSARPIVQAIARANRNGSGGQAPLSLVYAGPSGRHVQDVAEAEGLSEHLRCIGVVPRREVLALQASSLCTVVVTSVARTASLADRGIVTGKVFEAIALSPWVLVISPEGSDVRAMTATCPHVMHFHGGQIQEITDWLVKLANQPVLKERRNAVRRFAWVTLAAHFESVLTDVVDVRPSPLTQVFGSHSS